MDWITANISTLITLGIGGVMWFCADRIILFVIINMYPAQFFIDVATTVNKNLEKWKQGKTPEAAKKLEEQVTNSLKTAIKILES